MTLVIAHRGASAVECENSLSAFRRAREQGAHGVELDVHVTADGVPVVHHDPTTGALAIADATAVAVRAHRLANGEALPTLADALDVIGPDLEVFVEVKALPAAADAQLLAALDAGPAPRHYRIHSFDHRIVRRLKQQRPSLPCGVLSASYPVHPLRPLQDAGAGILWQEESLVDEELVEAAHASGYRVVAWTVDHPERMLTLARAGVDGVCTNRPDLALATLA